MSETNQPMGERHGVMKGWTGGALVPQQEEQEQELDSLNSVAARPAGSDSKLTPEAGALASPAPAAPPPPPPPPGHQSSFGPLTQNAPTLEGKFAGLWGHYPLVACILAGGLVCGLVGVKLFGPKSVMSADATASPTQAPASNATPEHEEQAPHPAKSQNDIQITLNLPSPSPAPALMPEPPTSPSLKANPFGSAADDDSSKKRSLLNQLQLIRSKIELYKLQHGDRVPEMSKYPQWAQLTGRTGSDGTPSPVGPFGPYLQSPPVNALNGFSKVGIVRKLPSAGEVLRAESLGFLYCPTTGEVAGIAKDGKTVFDEQAAKKLQAGPRNTASKSKPSAARPPQSVDKRPLLLSVLKAAREQIDLYKQEHKDQYPDFARYPAWDQLLRRTDRGGVPLITTSQESFGPYLVQPPNNPLNDNSIVEPIRHAAAYKPKPGVGFVFETSTGKLYATDADGSSILKE